VIGRREERLAFAANLQDLTSFAPAILALIFGASE
jgi:hypothetical protein